MNKFKYFGISMIMCYFSILVLMFITSIIFAYTSINDKYIDIFVYSIVGISIFVTSILLNRKIKSKGVIYGLLYGLLIISNIFLFGGMFFFGFNFSITLLIYFLISALSGLIGGIIGVNV